MIDQNFFLGNDVCSANKRVSEKREKKKKNKKWFW